MSGVSATSFTSNIGVTNAWKSSVAAACLSTQSNMIQVTIISTTDTTSVANYVPGNSSGLFLADRHTRHQHSSSSTRTTLLRAFFTINFIISFTQENFPQFTSVNQTSAVFRNNFESNVNSGAFDRNLTYQLSQLPNGTYWSENIASGNVSLSTVSTVFHTSPTSLPTVAPSTCKY